jgi:hypothetical protein
MRFSRARAREWEVMIEVKDLVKMTMGKGVIFVLDSSLTRR